MTSAAEDWFATHTHDAQAWSPASILALKRRHGAAGSISVVLPALNEAATIGAIVREIRAHLVEACPVVDEIVVMDCGSTDETAVAGRAAGAVVVPCDSVLPHFGPARGKGDALWRSIQVTHGNLMVYVDSDLEKFSSTLVVGLLGPLLETPGIQFVKSFFARSGQITDSRGGGGRLTEIVARPLINMFWPELARFVEPLSGQFAARRALLERLPFACGYGVDLYLLVQAWLRVGLPAMAQCDTGKLVHRNRSNRDLGQASMAILHTVLNGLAGEDRLTLREWPSARLGQFSEGAEGGYLFRTTDVPVEVRPPMWRVAGPAA